MSPLSPSHSDRPWGSFDEFISNTPCTVKIITVKPGESLSLQYHTQRSEFWVVLSGKGFVTIDDKHTETQKGDQHYIEVNTKHRAEAGDEGLTFLEISTGTFDEEDIIRLEDKYGRIAP